MVVKELPHWALERCKVKCNGIGSIEGNEYIWERFGVRRGSIASSVRGVAI